MRVEGGGLEIPDAQPCRQVSRTESVMRQDLNPEFLPAMMTSKCFNHYITGCPREDLTTLQIIYSRRKLSPLDYDSTSRFVFCLKFYIYFDRIFVKITKIETTQKQIKFEYCMCYEILIILSVNRVRRIIYLNLCIVTYFL